MLPPTPQQPVCPLLPTTSRHCCGLCLTRSKAEPPPRYSMMIHSFVPWAQRNARQLTAGSREGGTTRPGPQDARFPAGDTQSPGPSGTHCKRSPGALSSPPPVTPPMRPPCRCVDGPGPQAGARVLCASAQREPGCRHRTPGRHLASGHPHPRRPLGGPPKGRGRPPRCCSAGAARGLGEGAAGPRDATATSGPTRSHSCLTRAPGPRPPARACPARRPHAGADPAQAS